MTDIVERLRDPSKGSPRWLDTLSEAADEIERLRTEVNQLSTSCGHCGDLERAWAEAERLRATLGLIATMRPPIPQDAEGYGPNWDQYIYTRTWAFFAAELQSIASTALLTEGRR